MISKAKTSEEKDNLQMSFYKHVKEMNLSDENEEEIKEQFQAYIDEINNEIDTVLNEEQKALHHENM